jgi:hypothetical protein
MGSATKAGHTSSVEEEEDARHAWGGQKASGERRRKRGHSATFGTVEERELEGGGGRRATNGRRGPADRARGRVVEGGGRPQRASDGAGQRGSVGHGRQKGDGGPGRADRYGPAGVGRSERTMTFCNYSKLFKRL